ncbi:choice-of-anchor J domain-containing protein [Flavobacteriaceae bacterium S0825]|uniref:T9SS-dependent choice-of-anchor J family protein n=1 Tax=Gaetbulibacter sp. S0825 TaxID=2720084 RepID=UPI00142F496C|nr:choice-of-anchor J domain-containing protein [Gaetbulibacter sp. S0825]MCK0109187.1 choice-of-anchor J domain-containing protein [Flavobacteriaceae bacterium S0825]NIX64822.1 T9SS type A sorting domain-containing protein [Gaetbulibacter sp. S0825]
MKKITLLVLLMGTSLIYGQTYLSEGFEGSFPPAGWADVAGSVSDPGNNWALSTSGNANPDTSASNFGSQAAFFNDFTGTNDRWLVTPVIDLSVGGVVSPEFTYYEMTQYTFYANIGVYYSTDYAGDASTATWVPINVPVDKGADAQDLWTIRGAYDLSALVGNSSVYIGFNYQGNDESEWYIDDVVVRETPTCVEPSAASISNIMSTSADFSWTSGPGGIETLWDVELVDLTAGQTHDVDGAITSTGSNPYTFTSLTPGNSYAAYVRADCGGGDKSIWTGPYAFSPTASNDDVGQAQVVVQDVNTPLVTGATDISGTISGANNGAAVAGTSGETCSTSITEVAHFDVWYAFEARTDGVMVSLEANFDAVLVLYSGTPGSLVQVSCDDDGGSSPLTEEISASGLSAGTTYYIRVHKFDAASPGDPSFTLNVWSSETLSNDDVEDNAVEFRLYPNPVQDKLNLRAQDNIENVSIYNMLGQEVLRQAPNKSSSEVDMSALQAGSYFVKVTIDGVTETKQVIKR